MKDRGPKFGTLMQLILDTFRQANASGITWMMLAVTGICAMLCLSTNASGDAPIYAEDEQGYFLPRTTPSVVARSVVLVLAASRPLEAAALTVAASKEVWFRPEVNPQSARKEGVETVGGQITLAFGAISVPMGRERQDSVHFLELLLAGGIAGTLGVLLALVWTAGFVPTFLEAHAASVLLAKPAARWQLLLGKYFGVLTFVGCQVVLFVGSTWLALGVRTGVWDTAYLWCIPLLLLQFAVFYSFSVLLAVMTRSTVACAFGSVLFWLLGWGINYGAALARGMSETVPHFTRILSDAAYWISPKPIDAGLILFNALDAQRHFEKPVAFKLIEEQAFSPSLSILSCLALTAALLALSAHELNATDY
jgi:ABC-type transport system involved in multi-copper enzyme maturation permease subunit